MDKRLGALSATALTVVLAGCSSGSDAPDTGRLSLSVSDGPVHYADKICVEFEAVEVKKSGSPPELISDLTLQRINLLDFRGMNAAPLFIEQEIEAGDYQWVRLLVNAERGGNGGQGTALENSVGCDKTGSYVVRKDGSVLNLYVPAGADRGLQIVSGFTVAEGGVTAMVAEIDLQKSVVIPDGSDPTETEAKLRPAIRLVNELEVGAVTGTVSDGLATQTITLEDSSTAACAPSVYVFADGVAPNPIGMDGDPEAADSNDPIATAMVDNSDGTTPFQYTVGFLEPGDYDLAFTCDGETFDEGVGDVAIEAGVTKTVDFPVEATAQ